MSNGKILVCFHIYYQEQIPYFIGKMKNIHGCEWDLAVSFSELSEDSVRLIKEFRPDAIFIKSENTGYDIWPFIKTLKTINLDGYKYVLKIHTKNCDPLTNRINGIKLRGEYWRDMLVNALLKDGRQFEKALSVLEKDKMAGMVCNAALITNVAGFQPWGRGVLPNEMKRIGLDIKLRDKNMVFCAGTIFMARLEPFKIFVNADITPETFSDTGGSHLNNKMAHNYERILGFAVLANNYTIKGLWVCGGEKTRKLAHDIYSPVIKWIFSIDYDKMGEKSMTIFGFNFPLRSKSGVKA